MPARNTPMVGRVYSLGYIFTELVLDDDPSFIFVHQERDGLIQHEHMTLDELFGISGLSQTQWEYQSTIGIISPLFRYHGNIQNLLACIDIETTVDPKTKMEDPLWWATPKGYPYNYKKAWLENNNGNTSPPN